MDRSIVYPGSIPLDTDILLPQQRAMVAIGYALRAVMGTATVVDGLACNPTAPASMQVVVSAGSIITEQALESTDFGSVGADLGDTLVKMGINVSASTFTLTAPSVSGQSQNYLIQAQFSESDGTPVVLPYVNSSNPSQPFSGPNNSGTPQNTARKQAVALQLKAGAPANAGTQVTPPADTGAVGLYVITVNFGQASITAQAISQAPGAPFIKAKLPQLAPLLSPAFTGTPTAPTPASDDSSTKLATTAFVKAVSGGIAPGFANMQVFNSSGTFTVPAGITKLDVELWGGGGGGGGASSTTPPGGTGGGGGGYARGIYTVTPNQSIAVTVGAGGAGGAAGGGNGTNAGTSSFGSFLSATGGIAGVGNGSSSGQGGSGTGGAINYQGMGGGYSYPISAGMIGGAGGGTYQGPPPSPNTAGAGHDGQFPGVGGSGAAGNAAGGNGFHGCVVVRW